MWVLAAQLHDLGVLIFGCLRYFTTFFFFLVCVCVCVCGGGGGGSNKCHAHIICVFARCDGRAFRRQTFDIFISDDEIIITHKTVIFGKLISLDAPTAIN